MQASKASEKSALPLQNATRQIRRKAVSETRVRRDTEENNSRLDNCSLKEFLLLQDRLSQQYQADLTAVDKNDVR